MKKVYEKPMILFEDFTMNANVAGTCGITTVTPVEGRTGCGYSLMEGDTSGSGIYNEFDIVFVSEEMGCSWVFDDGKYNGICYDVPTAANAIFNS